MVSDFDNVKSIDAYLEKRHTVVDDKRLNYLELPEWFRPVILAAAKAKRSLDLLNQSGTLRYAPMEHFDFLANDTDTGTTLTVGLEDMSLTVMEIEVPATVTPERRDVPAGSGGPLQDWLRGCAEERGSEHTCESSMRVIDMVFQGCIGDPKVLERQNASILLDYGSGVQVRYYRIP